MTKFGYARISSTDPEGLLETQLAALRQAGCQDEDIFVDHKTGVAGHRPAFTRIMEKIQPDDELLTLTLDRIGRSVENIALTVEMITRKGASFRTLAEVQNIDTRPVANTGHRQLFDIFSQFTKKINVERREHNKTRRKGSQNIKWRLALTREQVLHAQDVIKNRRYSIAQLREELNVSSPTLYGYVGPDGELRDRGRRAVME